MHLFYDKNIFSDFHVLNEEETRHCVKVLRLNIGDAVYLTDGMGNFYETHIVENHAKKAILKIVKKTENYGKRNFNLHIAIAPTKMNERFEWFVEKSVEIGIDEITPVICGNSERKIIKTERINRVAEAAIIIGKHQNAFEEINADYVKKHNINVVRRISGGGAVYHDLNNLNYTIISNEEKGVDFDFKTFSQPVIDTLKELGVTAEFSGRNDILIDGKKICGNAQAYIKGRIMHHGCLLFNTELSVLAKALEIPKDIISSNATKSVRSAVDNILPNLPNKISVEEFADKLLAHMKRKFPAMKEYTFSQQELAEIEKNRASKFGTWEWNWGKSPKFDINRHSRYTAGKIQVFANVKNSMIENIKFYGTFFGKNSNLEEIENALIGVRYTYTNIENKLKDLNFNDYFAGFSLEELTKAIVD
jgi:lipoate-protein ligase A